MIITKTISRSTMYCDVCNAELSHSPLPDVPVGYNSESHPLNIMVKINNAEAITGTLYYRARVEYVTPEICLECHEAITQTIEKLKTGGQ